jgi:hypothetical protein
MIVFVLAITYDEYRISYWDSRKRELPMTTNSDFLSVGLIAIAAWMILAVVLV